MRISAFRDFGFSGAVRAWTQLTAVGMMVFAGRVLSQTDFGIYAVASVFTTLISTILFSGLYEFIIKSDDAADVSDTCFWINMAIAALGAAAMAALAHPVALAVGAPELRSVMWLLAPTCFLPALTSWQEAHLLRHGRVQAYYAVWFVAETLSAGLTVLLLARGFGIDALVGYRYSLGLATLIGYLLLHSPVPRLRFREPAAVAAWAFASRLFGSRFIGIASNYGADLIIGIFAGPAQAGAYRLASRIVVGIGEVCYQPARTLAWVRFSAAARDGRPLRADWLALMTLLSFIAWPTLACVALLAPEVTLLLLGEAWLTAAPVITVLALAKSFDMVETFLDPLTTLSQRGGWLVKIRLAACVLALGGFFALARFGAGPTAWVVVATSATLCGLTLWLGLRLAPASARDYRVLLPGLVTTGVAVGLASGALVWLGHAELQAWQRIAVVLAAGALAWGIMTGLVFRRTLGKALEALSRRGEPAKTVVKGPPATAGS